MNNEQATKILNRKSSSKEQLREALAYALGVDYVPFSTQSGTSLTAKCKSVLFEAYRSETGLDYSFAGADAKALSELIKKIAKTAESESEDVIYQTFSALIHKLPDWYKQNAFSLLVINKKYNEIIVSIKKNGNKQPIGYDYRRRIVDDLRS